MNPLAELADLQRRIAELEAALAVVPPPADTLQPNVIAVDPTTGAIGAQFSGKVVAKGLQINVDKGGPTQQISWNRIDNGALVASIFGDSNMMNAGGRDPNGTSSSNGSFGALDVNGNLSAGIQADGGGVASKTVRAVAGAASKLLLVQDGTSNYPQLDGLRTQVLGRLCSAYVNTATATPVPGNAWTAITSTYANWLVDYDPDSHWATDHFVVPAAGTYLCMGHLFSGGTGAYAGVMLNGTLYKQGALSAQQGFFAAMVRAIAGNTLSMGIYFSGAGGLIGTQVGSYNGQNEGEASWFQVAQIG